jgi:glycosyltransferase involved in cell wall biosynthesis
MPDVLQLITDTDGVRGAQVAAVELADALRGLGMAVDTAALAPGRSARRLDVPVLDRRARRAAIRSAGVVLAGGSSTLWAGALDTLGTGTGFVYRSIGDASAWNQDALRRLAYRTAVRRARAVVVLWPGAVDPMATRFGVDRSRIHVIPQAAPASRFPLVTAEARAAARANLGLDSGARIALFLGSLSAEKQVHVAIDAVEGMTGVDLVVVGDGPEAAALHTRRGPRVHFLGALEDPRVPLAAADVLVLPSRTEGVPGVLVEAGLSGLPSVASAVGGVPSVVEDGITGVLVAPGDVTALRAGIARALEDPELGRAARARCLDGFSLEVIAERWRVVLERAMTSTT